VRPGSTRRNREQPLAACEGTAKTLEQLGVSETQSSGRVSRFLNQRRYASANGFEVLEDFSNGRLSNLEARRITCQDSARNFANVEPGRCEGFRFFLIKQAAAFHDRANVGYAAGPGRLWR
jgi:hypothetical protein